VEGDGGECEGGDWEIGWVDAMLICYYLVYLTSKEITSSSAAGRPFLNSLLQTRRQFKNGPRGPLQTQICSICASGTG